MALSALVRHGTEVWVLTQEAPLTFGRDEDCGVRIGHAPLDDGVSRVAGRLELLDDAVLVRNESRSRPIHLRPYYRPQMTIAPRAAAAVLDRAPARVAVPSSAGTPHVLLFSLHGDAGGPSDDAPAVIDLRDPTRRPRLDPLERRLLAALCEPLLDERSEARGGGRAAGYADVAARTSLKEAKVRTVLNGLRERLSDEYGITAFRGDPHHYRPGTVNHVAALAEWAASTGLVTHHDLAALEQDDDAGPLASDEPGDDRT